MCRKTRRLHTKSGLQQTARENPFEKFLGKRPSLSEMYEFGVTFYSHIIKKSKLDKGAQEGQYVGKTRTAS